MALPERVQLQRGAICHDLEGGAATPATNLLLDQARYKSIPSRPTISRILSPADPNADHWLMQTLLAHSSSEQAREAAAAWLAAYQAAVGGSAPRQRTSPVAAPPPNRDCRWMIGERYERPRPRDCPGSAPPVGPEAVGRASESDVRSAYASPSSPNTPLEYATTLARQFPLNERTLVDEPRPAIALADYGLQSAAKMAVACAQAEVEHLCGLRLRLVPEASWHPWAERPHEVLLLAGDEGAWLSLGVTGNLKS